jgi:hypothetical protein
MLTKLTLRDQANAGKPAAPTLVMDWQDSVPLTPRLLITERIRIEWDAHEAQRDTEREAEIREEAAREQAARDGWAPLVDIDMMRRMNPFRNSDRELSGTSMSAVEPLSIDEVTALALEGFERNAFFLLVDGHQATELDETIPFRPTSQVTFVRLVPLVGG